MPGHPPPPLPPPAHPAPPTAPLAAPPAAPPARHVDGPAARAHRCRAMQARAARSAVATEAVGARAAWEGGAAGAAPCIWRAQAEPLHGAAHLSAALPCPESAPPELGVPAVQALLLAAQRRKLLLTGCQLRPGHGSWWSWHMSCNSGGHGAESCRHHDGGHGTEVWAQKTAAPHAWHSARQRRNQTEQILSRNPSPPSPPLLPHLACSRQSALFCASASACASWPASSSRSLCSSSSDALVSFSSHSSASHSPVQ